MNEDVECPYCEKWQEINHDDGYGYAENELHQQECSDCGKTFTYNTYISFDYESYQADCLNGGEHKYKAVKTFPVECTQMRCETCEEQRRPTPGEWEDIMAEYHNHQNKRQSA